MSTRDKEKTGSVGVLFVCLGNICRSPTAEGVFRHLVAQSGLDEYLYIDSCGTGVYHQGEAPDPRAQQEVARRGMSISHFRARGLEESDYQRFDYIIAMDHANLAELQLHAPGKSSCMLGLLLDFSSEHVGEVIPDPYYGGSEGFAHVFDLIEQGCVGLIEHIRKQEGWR